MSEKSEAESTCWRCWPQFCKCPPDDSEIEKIKSERFIYERKWNIELNRRRRAEAIIQKIIEDSVSGQISLPDIIKAADDYAKQEAHICGRGQ